jgi:hypothetical protein
LKWLVSSLLLHKVRYFRKSTLLDAFQFSFPDNTKLVVTNEEVLGSRRKRRWDEINIALGVNKDTKPGSGLLN